MLFPVGIWLIFTFVISLILSIWSWGFLIYFTFLVIWEIGYYVRCKKYNCVERSSYILAAIYGFIVGRSILCSDDDHFNILYNNPRSIWEDCKNFCNWS